MPAPFTLPSEIRVRALPPHLGSVDQFVDAMDVLDDPARLAQIRPFYAALAAP